MSKYGIAAVHGGEYMEPGTSEIAKNIAGGEYQLYVNESGHHVPSNEFESSESDEFLAKVSIVISIHGEKDTQSSFAMIGGLDKELGKNISESLREAGFEVILPLEGLHGDNPKNFCNRGSSGKGVQIEISRKLRGELSGDLKLMGDFCGAIRSALV